MKGIHLCLSLLIILSITMFFPIAKAQTPFVIDYFKLSTTRDCIAGEFFPNAVSQCTFWDSELFVVSELGGNFRSFLGFAGLSQQLPAIRNTVINASLSIYKADTTGTGTRTYEISRITANGWNETGLTWNNQPPAGVDTSTTVVTLNQVGWYSFNSTAIVKSWVDNKTGEFGVRLKDTVEDATPLLKQSKFYSREDAHIPGESFNPILHVNITGYGNLFVSGFISFTWITILILMILGGIYIASVARKR